MNNEKFKIDITLNLGQKLIPSNPIQFLSLMGKNSILKQAKKTIEFIKNKITPEVLELFDSIYITKWKGYSGTTEILKDRKGKNDINPINKELIEILLTF